MVKKIQTTSNLAKTNFVQNSLKAIKKTIKRVINIRKKEREAKRKASKNEREEILLSVKNKFGKN